MAVDTPPGPPPEVRYRMQGAVDDSGRLVSGQAGISFRHRRAYPLPAIDFSLAYNAPGNGSGPRALPVARLDGRAVALSWVTAADSTLARLHLPVPLRPGDSTMIELTWRAPVPAALASARGHARRVDLVGWYPRLLEADSAKASVAMPALASIAVVLDLAADQVVGGTGVVTCGDPGWRRVEVPTHPDAELAAPAAASRPQCDGAVVGRRRVGWVADSVTEVGYAASPGFRFEVGDVNGDSVYVLYEDGGERQWGAGLVARRAETALAWLAEIGGPYPWPQLTVVEGTGSPGRALPMFIVADAPSQATVLNLLGLVYSRQVLPGSESPLAVGAAAFQAAWFFETLGGRDYYARIEREVLDWDLDGLARPGAVEALPGASTIAPCTNTACRRVEFLLHQLRGWTADDRVLRELLRGHVARYRLKPAVQGSFQAQARQVIRPRPDTLYWQVPTGLVLYDDAVSTVARAPAGDGTWRTTVVLERRAEGVFPRTLLVVADLDTAEVRLPGLAVRETVLVATRTRPHRVVLDPYVRSHDWNMLNNQRGFGRSPVALLGRTRPSDNYADGYFTRHTARDGLTRGWAPAAWYNDRGGWMVGMRVREDYLGRFELNEAWLGYSTGAGTDGGRRVAHAWVAIRNPVWLRATGWSQSLSAGWLEGRAAVGLALERRIRRGIADPVERVIGVAIGWHAVTDPSWVDPGYYDDAGTLELSLVARRGVRQGRRSSTLVLAASTGLTHGASGTPGVAGGYGRLSASGALRRPVADRLDLGVRGFAGGVVAGAPVPRQRRFFLAGAGPLERFGSPLLRSRGSILARPGLNYHEPGDGGMRGLDPRLSGERIVAGSVELEYVLRPRPAHALLGRAVVVAFLDAGVADGDLDGGGSSLRGVADAGLGIRLEHRIGQTAFQTRLEFPVWVSRPERAQADRSPGALGLRWLFSFRPAILPT